MNRLDHDHDFAAMLVVALDSGLLSLSEAVAVIDREIAEHPSPPAWLLDASLATQQEDMLGHARRGAEDHPAVSDLAVWIDAVDIALARGRSPEGLGARLLRVKTCGEGPYELTGVMWDLDEEVGCAHATGGVPQSEAVARAIRDVASASPRSEWRAALETIGGTEVRGE